MDAPYPRYEDLRMSQFTTYGFRTRGKTAPAEIVAVTLQIDWATSLIRYLVGGNVQMLVRIELLRAVVGTVVHFHVLAWGDTGCR